MLLVTMLLTIRSGVAGLVTCALIGTLRRVDEKYFQKPLPKICGLAPPIPTRLGPGATSDQVQRISDRQVHLTVVNWDRSSAQVLNSEVQRNRDPRDKNGLIYPLDAPRRP